MKEIWDLAVGAQVLPFTLLLIPVALYWVLAALGTVDLDFLHIDVDAQVDGDLDGDLGVDAGDAGEAGADASAADGHGPVLGMFHGALKLVNATDVPVMIVLSIMLIMMWMCAMLGNLWFNAEDGNFRGTIIGGGALVAGAVLTRLLTEPLKPVFRAMKGDGTPNRPVVGRSGTVRTAEITDQSGQVEIEEKGEVLLLNARLPGGASPLARGTEVIVYDYNAETGIYYVKSLSTS